MPGSTRRLWRTQYVPALIARGALAGDGNGWLGRQFEIERALLGASGHTELHRWLYWLTTLGQHATYPNAAIALATGGTSWALHLVTAVPLLMLGAGLLAGRIARRWE